MRLSIGTGGSLVWLARGSAAGELFRDLTIDGQRLSSVTPLIGAALASVRDFGNLTHTVGFTVERQHASLEDANLFCFRHASLLNLASGTITAVSESAGREQALFLKSAVVTRVASQLAGISTTTAYQILCADITTTL